MNILHIASTYPPAIGGTATTTPALARELIRRGHRAPVLTRDTPGYPRYEINGGIPVYRSRGIPGEFYKPPIAFLKSIAMGIEARELISKEKIDVLHAHDINVSAIAGIIGAKFKDVKMVTKFPGPLSWELLSLIRWRNISLEEFLGSSDPLVRLFERVQKVISGQYDAIIAPSRYIKRVLEEYSAIEGSKIHVLYNGINIEPFSEKFVPELRKSLMENARYLVVSACRMVPWKGIEYLIDAFKILSKEYQLILIGDGPLKKKLQRQAVGLNVMFLGRMTHREVQTYMRASDVYVMPSIYENFPLAALDCLATQTPIVATDVGGMSEIIENGKTGLLVKGRDHRAIAEGVERLAEDEQLKDRIKENQRRVCKKFLWGNIIQGYINLYESLVE
jgi:glycosyltransferase involved in cell wall biosynthesis